VAEIANVIVFLTSKEAGFLTGQTIFIDGGLTAA
jgi:NAD(P)-dependent dehydrogenase (short-subunit alcohol dehydrogenase family)